MWGIKLYTGRRSNLLYIGVAEDVSEARAAAEEDAVRRFGDLEEIVPSPRWDHVAGRWFLPLRLMGVYMVAAYTEHLEPPSDPLEYEVYCAGRLAGVGWQVETTSGTGDQGVDLLARQSGRIVAIQCKRYSRPVGNNAVQQAFSGMHYLGATEAAVVATGGFTASARALAKRIGVRLLGDEELEGL
jgi:hypothetical protein